MDGADAAASGQCRIWRGGWRAAGKGYRRGELVQHDGVVVYCCAADRGVCVCARAQGVTRRSALTGLQMAHHPNPKGAKEVCGAPNPIKAPSHSAWATPTMQAGQDSDG